MKYTNYIMDQIDMNGTINAPVESIRKLARIQGYERMIEFYTSLEIDGFPNKYELQRFQLGKQITEITKNLAPDICIPKIITGDFF